MGLGIPKANQKDSSYEEFNITVSPIKRVLKALALTWRRIRRKPKGEPDKVEYQQKTEALETFKSLDKQGDLRYFDESGFCLVPYIYAWQQKGATIEIETTKSRRLNVLGFLNRENELQAYTFEGSVNSDVASLVSMIFLSR